MIYSAVTAFAYGCAMYAIGWNYGRLDGRKIPGSYPRPAFPFQISALGAIIPVFLLGLRLGFPDIWPLNLPFLYGEYEFFLTDNRLQGTTDMLYKLWYFPFESFLGNGRIITYVLALFVQPVLVTAGYFVGLTKFKLLDAIVELLVFSKKNKEE